MRVGNILDYVASETRTFAELPFNEVDALVFAQLAYEDVPDAVPTLDDLEKSQGTLRRRLAAFSLRHPLAALRQVAHPTFSEVTISELDRLLHGDDKTGSEAQPEDDANRHETHRGTHREAHHEAHMVHFVDPKVIHDFHRAVASSPRFADVLVGAFGHSFDTDQQTQFAAVTYLLNDEAGTMVVAFRGTDDSLVGWKEDFNMSFQYPVPAQRSAADYVRRLAALRRSNPLILVGHSKGGNLAVYAAMNADERTDRHIERVFSLDGPGFPDRVVHSGAYAAVSERVTKIVPDSSIIGMILETPEPCEVIASDAAGLMQHFAFSWQVEGDRFVRRDEVASSSQTFNAELSDWMASLTEEQREHAVDALFSVLGASGASDFSGLMSAMPMAIPSMIGTAAGLTPDERRHIGSALKILAAAAMARRTPTKQ